MVSLLLLACGPAEPALDGATTTSPQDAFWANLGQQCGQAFEGRITMRPETDRLFRGDEVLTVHFRECRDDELRLPFHVEDNRSRTWILTRQANGLDLRHDHRHRDGTPEEETMYGGRTFAAGTPHVQDFVREPDGGPRTGWRIEIHPGERYTYGTIRDGEYGYRLDFDLTRAVEPPPAPWGHEATSAEDLRTRRQRAFERLPDGILLLHARARPKSMQEGGFEQNPSFFYFTGLANQVGGILALDGPRQQAHLFVPDHAAVFGYRFEERALPVGAESARRLGLDGVHPWDEFIAFVRGRIEGGTRTLYLEETRRPEFGGLPAPMLPIAGESELWRRAIEAAFPDATISPAREVIYDLRWVKSPAEIRALRRNAEATARAAQAGMASIRPGVRQREVEAAVVHACLMEGAQGPSFWPWAMSGPNAHVPTVAQSFIDYQHLDRVMEAGELVRLDIGCAGGGYGADVGRTIPVSGRFTDDQRETWDLVIAAYRAGLAAMRPGVSFGAVAEASRQEVRRLEPGLRTAQARAAAAAVDDWELLVHGVGIESSEHGPTRLEAGAVIAYEPMLSVGEDAFFLEDMILITSDGHEILSSGLPYSADQIEAAMARVAAMDW